MKKNNGKENIKDKRVGDMAFRLTKWIGSPKSLITHTAFFVICFFLPFFGINVDRVLLFLTTIVSLEAIYLAILIQLSVNRNTEDLLAVAKDIDEIEEDIDEIQEDVGEIAEDVDEIQKDVDVIERDIDEIEEDTGKSEKNDNTNQKILKTIHEKLEDLTKEIDRLKK